MTTKVLRTAGLLCLIVNAGLCYGQIENQPKVEPFTPPPPVRTKAPSKKVARVAPLQKAETKVVPLRLSPKSTKEEVMAFQGFREPLMPVDGSDSPSDRAALMSALGGWLKRSSTDDYTKLEEFLVKHPRSVWTPGVRLNLAYIYYETGYFSKALASWQTLWEETKGLKNPEGGKLATIAASELAVMLARVGRMEELESLLKEVESRSFRGNALIQIDRAREGLWNMKNRPGIAFRCGPYALNLIYVQKYSKAKEGFLDDKEVASPREGFSLTRLREFAEAKLGMTMQVARRSPGSRVITPAVVHWKVNHFGALLREQDGNYLVKDPTFGNDTWVTSAALDSDSSGYFLVPEGPLPEGWSKVSMSEGASLFGKGHSGNSDPDETTGCDPVTCDACEDGHGMATYRFHSMLAGLHIFDIPVGYSAARGPSVAFKVSYNMKEAGQPSTMTFTNFSPQWENEWCSYLEDNPGVPGANIKVNLPGGGAETHTGYNATTLIFGKNRRWDTILARLTANSYERRMPDGSKMVYAHAIGTTGPARKVFLSQVVDPQGNAVTLNYDTTPGYETRLLEIVDATGLVTTLQYQEPGEPYLVTEIEDPFGRSAQFTYQTVSGAKRLTTITDVIGLQSSFEYDGSGLITALVTPYGRTTFAFGSPNIPYGLIRWIEATDPQGGKERIEYHLGSYMTKIPNRIPLTQVPLDTGYNLYIEDMDDRNTFYWSRKAMYHAAGDYSKAHLYHWLQVDGADVASGVLEGEKPAYGSRVWYRYPGQTEINSLGTSAKPILSARLIEDESGAHVSAFSQFEYNDAGNTTRMIDELGRDTAIEYETNLIDVKAVKQKVGGVYQTLSSATYDPGYPAHRMETVTDAAGQTTTFTYNAFGQVATVTNPLNDITTFTYETNAANDGYGQVKLITGALPGATTAFTFDGFQRIRTVTDSSGYTTTFDYDDMDRVTLITYPDTTTEQIVYEKLDLFAQKDREGRWTRTWHNALRKPVLIVDALSRTMQLEWCKCGALQKLVDGRGNLTRWQYDEQGRNTAKFYANGKTTAFTYQSLSGRLSSITDSKGQVKHFSYFLDGQVKQVSYGNATVATAPVSFTYDSEYPGRVLTMTDGVGTTSYAYHPVGSLGALRVSTEDGPRAGNSDLIAYTYDALGRIKTRNIGSVGNESLITWTYDSLGRPVGEVNNLGAFVYNYVAETERLADVEYPNGQKTLFDYFNAVGDHRLKTSENLGDGTNPASTLSRFDYTYTPNGNLVTWQQQVGSSPATRFNLLHDAIQQLTAATLVEAASPTTILERSSFQYDRSGNRVSNQKGNVVVQAAYNQRNQLTATTGGGKLLVEGCTDEAASVTVNGVAATTDTSNNYQAWIDVVPGANTVTVEASDFAPVPNATSKSWLVTVTSPGSRSFTYDDNGNTLTDGLRTFEWDAENRLVKIIQGVNVYEFAYDGIGRRVAQKVNGTWAEQWVWSGLILCEERDNAGSVTRRFYGGGEEWVGGSNAGDYYYTRDHLGSVRELTDNTAAIRARYTYDLWGQRTQMGGDLNTQWGYTGHFHHVSGVVLAPFRAYDPGTGRWLSEDPIGELGGVNLYGYVGNSTDGSVDFLGLVDMNFFSPSEKRIYDSANRAANGLLEVITVGGHGNPMGMLDTNRRDLSPQKLASLIRAHPKFDGKRPVYLMSCGTGATRRDGLPNFAQQLANELGVTVWAPDQYIWYWDDGYTNIGNANICHLSDLGPPRGENWGHYYEHKPVMKAGSRRPIFPPRIPEGI
ncbi:RHS repeat-associated core domain-containing protein [Roseimicrobium sp. ORNL1]|uniref:RHS repeat-associated core domain-containing protein n=1 Tax=Roseimicrobium sp. ORNL1 TaxID=2711231 RepID=UPI0013E12AE5|nr:RHS repeat-associated core domain-containing protein [Roseimicrobium sp. ORNL1]QIF02262.1 hypothetical protein G5S37_12240 [Roseimicrobium sp. ORNL1]